MAFNGKLFWLAGNIAEDPLFINPDDLDFTLSRDSKCINTGISFYQVAGDTLLNLRPEDYVGHAPDMGAFEYNSTTYIEQDNSPQHFVLQQNYPNPFNNETIIEYIVGAYHDTPLKVTLTVYDVLGRHVKVLVNKNQPAGQYKVTFDASDLASGIYYYRLVGRPSNPVSGISQSSTGSGRQYIQTRKMLLLK